MNFQSAKKATGIAAALAIMTVALSACGGGGDDAASLGGIPISSVIEPDNGRGSVISTVPPQMTSLTASQFTALLQSDATGSQILQLAGPPLCGIETHELEYRTVGTQGEPASATGAIMLPRGSNSVCNGPRPVLLFTHSTIFEKAINFARWTDPALASSTEATVAAAFFAAQGYIVVAPNYAGYDRSSLPYHPYLDGDQQGKDVVDALTAARKTFVALNAVDSGVLLITGYSQGGYVAMAAHRELQATGQKVTASAPLAGPTAFSLNMDADFSGRPALLGTGFLTFIISSRQKQFGDIYVSPAEFFEAQYAIGIDTLLPATVPLQTLFQTGKLPATSLFPANAVPTPVGPEYQKFYGNNNLIRQSALTAIYNDIQRNPCSGNVLPATAASLASAAPLDCHPESNFRKAAVANDLRNWVPTSPMFLCSGSLDPTSMVEGLRATAGYFLAKGMPASALTLIDLEDAAARDDYSSARAGFAAAKASYAAGAAGDAAAKSLAVYAAYHGTLAPPFCFAAARRFFNTVQAVAPR